MQRMSVNVDVIRRGGDGRGIINDGVVNNRCRILAYHLEYSDNEPFCDYPQIIIWNGIFTGKISSKIKTYHCF